MRSLASVRFLFLAVVISGAHLAHTQQPMAIVWENSLGGSFQESGWGMTMTADGGHVVVGMTSSNNGDVSGLHGQPQFSADAWVVRLDRDGQLLWQRCFGGSSTERFRSVAATPDGGFILAGYTQSNNGDVSGNHGMKDTWVVKVTGAGVLQWQRCLGGSDNDEANAVLPTPDGGYLVAGQTFSANGDVSGALGSGDLWVVKLDASGALQWEQVYGGSGTEGAHGMVRNNNGHYVIAGFTNSQNGHVGGTNGLEDYWLLAIDDTGTLLWQETYGGSASDMAYGGLAACADGGHLVVGSSGSSDGDVSANWGGSDIWLIKTDAFGQLLWERNLGSGAIDNGYAVAECSNGDVVVAGFAGAMFGNVSNPIVTPTGYDYWLVRLDAQGQLLWDFSLGGTGQDQAYSLLLTPDDDILVTGSCASSDVFVTGHHGGSDMWTVKLTARFNMVTGQVFTDLDSDAQPGGPDEITLPFLPVMHDGTSAFTLTDTAGRYALHVLDTGTAAIRTPVIPHFQTLPGQHTLHFSALDSVASGYDFAYQPLAPVTDIATAILPVGPFRPGFSARYHVVCANLGSVPQAPLITLQADPQLILDQTTLPATTWSMNTATWQLPALAPLEHVSFMVTVQVSFLAPLGQWLYTSVGHDPLPGDVMPQNDALTSMVLTQGSFDPNDIAVDHVSIPLSEVQAGATPLEYLIRFQNTGTDTAFTVQVENPLPELADGFTFQFIGTSHPVTISVRNDRTLWFRFAQILLPDSGTNEALSHGFIRYRLWPRTDLAVGDSILNTASIYFDFNAPVVTNTAYTVVDQTTSNPAHTVVPLVGLAPNPATGLVRITSDRHEEGTSVQVLDPQGRLVRAARMSGTSMYLDLGGLRPGLFTVLLVSATDTRARRLVVE